MANRWTPPHLSSTLVVVKQKCQYVGSCCEMVNEDSPFSPSIILSLSGSARGRWYKFNDNVVEEFDMNDETLEYECFGGEYRPKVYDQCR